VTQGTSVATIAYTVRTGLPTDLEAERGILGSILFVNSSFKEAAEQSKVDHFSLDTHRKIYARMVDLIRDPST
jgi:replicative DNA helicase